MLTGAVIDKASVDNAAHKEMKEVGAGGEGVVVVGWWKLFSKIVSGYGFN